ncbi:MAG: reverse transcriptase family protein, partial [Sedimenticola sp.]
IRKEFACSKEEFLNEIMENPTNKHFYRLIRRSQTSSQNVLPCLVINGEETTDLPSQRNAFARYFEDLAVPKQDDRFDSPYLDLSQTQVKLINAINELQQCAPVHITEDDVNKAINTLNTGKSPDETALKSEHLKYAGKTITPTICAIFNKIISEGEVPAVFKTGVITPIHKKGKDPSSLDNYRGITITSIFGKLFETVLLQKMTTLNANQSELQFGFTKGLSPNMASLLLSESIVESQAAKCPLYVATLDSQKAFDVVHHQILLQKLYHQGINGNMWSCVQSMYSGLSAKVKWFGEVSDILRIQQGVRQGGILSTHFYKTYINDLLLDLESRSLGNSIGTTYTGCPTCADDVLLISDDPTEMQSMLDLVNAYSKEHRYHIHPQKSAVLRRLTNKTWKQNETISGWYIGDTELSVQKQATHLGMTRCSRNESGVNVEDRIKLARRTLYALMRSGMHGSNGLNPKVSYQIYQTYVIPRLLYSLETIPLNISQLKQLERFHTKTLKNLQSLPERTSNAAVLLLLGALPIEAEIHKRQLSLAHAISQSRNSKMRSLMERQVAVGDKTSFFTTTKATLLLYSLPQISSISKYTKTKWKVNVKSALESYWTNTLVNEANQRSTLLYCNTSSLKIGKTHPVWNTVTSSVADVKKGITKARLLTGTYVLQSNRAKFNKQEVDDTCPLCRLEKEDTEHMIIRCPALVTARTKFLPSIRTTVINQLGEHVWKQLSNRQSITSLVIDCTTILSEILPQKKDSEEILHDIESQSRHLCHQLHVSRLQQTLKLSS